MTTYCFWLAGETPEPRGWSRCRGSTGQEYFGAFWKYSTRQLEFWSEQAPNAQKTIPQQNQSIVFSINPYPISVTAFLRQGLRVEPFTRIRGRQAPQRPDVHRYEPPVRTSKWYCCRGRVPTAPEHPRCPFLLVRRVWHRWSGTHEARNLPV